jgi:class 3 adenylate cyclase
MGRTVAAVEVGIKGRRSLDRVYRRIDSALAGQLGPVALVDPFEEPATLPKARQRRLDELLDRLTSEGIDPGVAECLGDFLAHAPAQEVARIRPLALARRLGLPPDAVVAACLRGARAGLLALLWDLLCPICRIPSEIKDTLRALKEHGHCEACNLDFELDFARSVELIFRAHPDIRDAELGIYCIAGPAHSPHVVSQVRLAPGERVEIELSLSEGSYRVRGPQLPYAIDFRVQAGSPLGRWDVSLRAGIPRTELRALRPGAQVIALKNEHDRELVARIERTAGRDDALTAARAASLGLFRELFPTEVLSPGHLVSVATITLLVTDLDLPADTYTRLGDAPAFAIIHEHFRLLDERIRVAGGALIKTVGEGLLAVFEDPVAAVETALDLQAILLAGEFTRSLQLRAGVHRGPAMAATLNDHLDYFGATVRDAAQLPALARGGEVILTQAIAGDPRVAALLAERKRVGELMDATPSGFTAAPLLRLTT